MAKGESEKKSKKSKLESETKAKKRNPKKKQ
jgi:hypothetical protein